MRSLFVFCFLVVSMGLAFGQSEDFALPKGLIIVLPKAGAVQAEWVAPPLAEAQVQKAGFSGQKFRMDRQKAVWMAHNQKVLTNLASGMTFSLARQLNDFIWLDDGALFIASENSIGIIPPLKKGQIVQKGVPQVPYQPICGLPAQHCSLASDGKDAIFVYGYDQATQTYAVFELLKGFAGWQKVFVSNEKIAAVCVDGKTLYIAAGRMVYKMRLEEKEASVVFVHPLDFITGIAYAPGTGLFYATYYGIGVVNGPGIEFIKCKGAQIEIKDKMLYVFMPESLGVMRLRNIERLVGTQIKKQE